MARTAAALEALEGGDPVPRVQVAALDEVLGRLERAGVASGEQLRDLLRLLRVASTLRAYAKARRDDIPLLAEVLWTDPVLEGLSKRLERSIDDDGCVTDAASPALAGARSRVRHSRKRLVERLGQLSSRFEDVLRDARHVELDGRYALAVRADAHRKVDGIVLGSSGSGATLYVEPPAVTQLSNRLKLEEAEVEREEARVLAELSGAAQESIAELRTAYEVGIEADQLAAITRWATDARAHAVTLDDRSEVELRAMRHPLLVLQDIDVVPSDVALAAGRGLVISGPNAGGKTVALKCLGLAVLMARSGIPLPASGESRIGWFSNVLTDVGDAQSIAQSLSTFSAHVAHLAEVLDQADEHCMVLIDEIAGGTDPEQGAALAGAVLEGLVERGAAVAVTTHYDKLKELAGQDARFDNASVGFDFDSMQPTFRLTMGVPGASSALAVASRFGIPAPVLERAKALMPEPALEREQLLAALQREQRALERARSQAEHDARAAEVLRQELETQRAQVREKERRKLRRESEDLVSEIRGARQQLREALDSVSGAGDKAELRRAEKLVDKAAQRVARGSAVDQATRDEPATPALDGVTLAVGDTVYVERLGANAEVVSPPERGEVQVRAGAFSLRVPVGELRAAAGGKKKAKQAHAPKPRPSKRHPDADAPDLDGAIRTSDNTCDLRGMRVEEALGELDRFVDIFSSASEPVGFVLHGHGTGALKQAVREHLAASTRIAESRPAEQRQGGDAFTVFWLRR
jgi:DNA mismatch repair protein MutS2